jgi:L-alanine-DL-glutamate epimerase-like enolase superfamily enzyme
MWGGIESLIELEGLSPFLGFEMAVHSLFETGIGTAANLHLAAALGRPGRATDFGLHLLAEELTTPLILPVRDGRVRVPQGPGLGVVPDAECLRRYQTDEITIAA